MRRPARRAPRPLGDEGFTLTEVLVSMTILSIVMVVVLSAILQIFGAVNRTEGTSFARDQIGNTFRRLDKELRYANWVSTPGQVGTRWYMEYSLPTGCRQLIYNDGVLTLAAWTDPDRPGTPTTIASDLVLSGTTQPFTMWPIKSKPYATASAGTAGVGKLFTGDHPQIRVQFNVVSGKTTLPFDVVYTAHNVDANTTLENDCSAGRPTS